MKIPRSMLLLVPAVILAIGCGAGTSTSSSGTTTNTGESATPAAEKGPTTVKVGEALTLTEEIFGSKTVAAITLSNPKAGYKSSNQFDKPEKGQYIVFDVAVSVSAGKFSISATDFKLVAADGTAFDTSFVSSIPMFTANDLTPGQKSAGKLVFDAAKGAEKGAKVALKNILAEGDAGYWTLP